MSSVRGLLEASASKYVSDHDADGIWDEPIIGFADVRSFGPLRMAVHPDHLMPDDILPGATVVVSVFVPFDPKVSRSNVRGTVPSDLWVSSYRDTNGMSVGLLECLVSAVRSIGSRAGIPGDTGRHRGSTYSVWSQRHIAYLAGLGTFGMNNMLITRKGCCGRFYSLVTDLDVPADVLETEERCLFKRDGSCGACMRRCVVSALKVDGFDRDACDAVCRGNEAERGEDVCGKCMVGMPCSFLREVGL